MNLIEPDNVEWLRVLYVLSTIKRCSKRPAFSLRANTNFLSHSDTSAYRICIYIGVGAHYVISASTPRRIGLAETMERSLAPALHQYRSAMRRAPSIRQDRTGHGRAKRASDKSRRGRFTAIGLGLPWSLTCGSHVSACLSDLSARTSRGVVWWHVGWE